MKFTVLITLDNAEPYCNGAFTDRNEAFKHAESLALDSYSECEYHDDFDECLDTDNFYIEETGQRFEVITKD